MHPRVRCRRHGTQGEVQTFYSNKKEKIILGLFLRGPFILRGHAQDPEKSSFERVLLRTLLDAVFSWEVMPRTSVPRENNYIKQGKGERYYYLQDYFCLLLQLGL